MKKDTEYCGAQSDISNTPLLREGFHSQLILELFWGKRQSTIQACFRTRLMVGNTLDVSAWMVAYAAVRRGSQFLPNMFCFLQEILDGGAIGNLEAVVANPQLRRNYNFSLADILSPFL